MRPINWIPCHPGKIALWPRPARRHFSGLSAMGVTHLVTLLKESEGAALIGSRASNQGLGWVWLPLLGARPPAGDDEERTVAGIRQLQALLIQDAGLLIHCSAGIHRTGMIACTLLRLSGFDQESALQALENARPEVRWRTSQGLRAFQLAWCERVVERLLS